MWLFFCRNSYNFNLTQPLFPVKTVNSLRLNRLTYTVLVAKRVLLMTDKNLSKLPPVQQAMQSLDAAGVDFELYDEVVIEPTSVSMQHAIDYARNNHFDAYCAVGGGSVMDTAKGNRVRILITVRSNVTDTVNFI